MNTLLTTLYTTIPNTSIILSTLLPNKKHPDQVAQISSQYRELVALRQRQGYRIVLAEMSSFIKLSQLMDGTHPGDYGYMEMAAVWWAAFLEAQAEGFLEFADGTGVDGRIGVGVEVELDGGDSTGDPGLPSYTTSAPAPAETGVTDASGSAKSGGVKSGSAKSESVVNSGEVRGIGLVRFQAFAGKCGVALFGSLVLKLILFIVGIGLSLSLWL